MIYMMAGLSRSVSSVMYRGKGADFDQERMTATCLVSWITCSEEAKALRIYINAKD